MRGFNNEVLSKLVGCFRFGRNMSEQSIRNVANEEFI